jgi:putative PIN family toxin of toxin-antitoxin system
MRRKPRLVLDTNVVVSGTFWGGKPGALLALAGDGEIRLHTSAPLLAELRATLLKPKLARALDASGHSPAELVAEYRRAVTVTRAAASIPLSSRDPDDNRVLACAVAVRADAIVTGDDDLLSMKVVSGIPIRTVAEALEWLDGLG